MIKTTYQIRFLKENYGAYSGESPIIFESTDEEKTFETWQAGYQRSNIENVTQIFGLFKVTSERLDDPASNKEAITKHEAELAGWQRKHGKISFADIHRLAIEQMDANDIDNHCTDLYLRRNEISTALVRRYESSALVTTFRCNVECSMWYEIPFAYNHSLTIREEN
jgi:hypothetical protein